MEIHFYKYQGAGNDFVVIDNRAHTFPKQDQNLVAKLCDRRFGIGADGLLLLENSNKFDFKMVYYNADGKEGTMCGNGGRCIVAFAKFLDIIHSKTTFEASDGIHEAIFDGNLVNLKMINISQIKKEKEFTFLNSGSPHHIIFTKNINQIDVNNEGASIRYGTPYFEEGTNVNFVEKLDNNSFKMRTYERGVENETLACGTGATAVAIAAHATQQSTSQKIDLQVLGGNLQVSFKLNNGIYEDIFLKGPAEQVFEGKITI
ncbi:MAG: diaminopimelate epimerase [Lutibacter sp.]